MDERSQKAGVPTMVRTPAFRFLGNPILAKKESGGVVQGIGRFGNRSCRSVNQSR